MHNLYIIRSALCPFVICCAHQKEISSSSRDMSLTCQKWRALIDMRAKNLYWCEGQLSDMMKWTLCRWTNRPSKGNDGNEWIDERWMSSLLTISANQVDESSAWWPQQDCLELFASFTGYFSKDVVSLMTSRTREYHNHVGSEFWIL